MVSLRDGLPAAARLQPGGIPEAGLGLIGKGVGVMGDLEKRWEAVSCRGLEVALRWQ